MKTIETIETINTLVESITSDGGRVYEVRNPNLPNSFGVKFPPSWDVQRRDNFITAASAAHGLSYFESALMP